MSIISLCLLVTYNAHTKDICDYSFIDVSQIQTLAKVNNLKWNIVEEGAEIHKVDVHDFGDGYRGLVAIDDINSDELVIFIPDSLLLR